MTSLEIYVLASPLILAAAGWALALWSLRQDRQSPRTLTSSKARPAE